MAALLDKAEQMASMDWRVAPVPWRQHLATPGRPLKVAIPLKQKAIKTSKRMFVAVCLSVTPFLRHSFLSLYHRSA